MWLSIVESYEFIWKKKIYHQIRAEEMFSYSYFSDLYIYIGYDQC